MTDLETSLDRLIEAIPAAKRQALSAEIELLRTSVQGYQQEVFYVSKSASAPPVSVSTLSCAATLAGVAPISLYNYLNQGGVYQRRRRFDVVVSRSLELIDSCYQSGESWRGAKPAKQKELETLSSADPVRSAQLREFYAAKKSA